MVSVLCAPWQLLTTVCAWQVFPEILKESSYVTTNAEEADYFYADAWIFWPHALNHMDDIVAAIRAKGPWFDRKNATDHIFVITGETMLGSWA